MNKQEFLIRLRKGLAGLPKDDIEERLTFYSEMIDDRIEEGFSEEDAVCEIGNIDELILQITADIPFTKIVKEKITSKKRLKWWEVVLLIIGSPVWFSLLIAIAAVILSLYVSLWTLIISLWAVFASLVVCGLFGTVAGIVIAVGDYGLTGIATIGVSIVCAGLSIFTFYGCKSATKGVVILTKKIVLWIKNCFIRKEEA